jgi:hypothetical protein
MYNEASPVIAYQDSDWLPEHQPGSLSGIDTLYQNQAYQALGVIGMATGAYHGYKRNDSVGWAIVWALLGGAVPIITIPVSIAQGYGKRVR